MNLASRDYHEKRRFIRMKVETPVQLTVPDQPPLLGTCHNLSGGGMLVSAPKDFALGTELQVLLKSNHGHTPMLKAVAHVNRILPANHAATKNTLFGLEIVALLD